METSRIGKLLAKYYDGQTTEEEELELERYFASGDVPAGMEDERLFFMHLHGGNAGRGVPEGFDRRLETMIDGLASADTYRSRNAVTPRYRLRAVAGIAASVLLVASLGFGLLDRASREPTVTADDRAALAQAQEAILKFSTTLNKGLVSMEQAGRETRAIGERMNKCLKMTKIPSE